MLTICLLILAFSILGKPVKSLVRLLGNVNWSEKAQTAFTWICKNAKKAGRKTTEGLLTFWYVMNDENTSTLDKILIFALIAYVVIPMDFIPYSVRGWLGLIDDGVAFAFVYKIVGKEITDDIRTKVDTILDDWFGKEGKEEIAGLLPEATTE